MSSSPTLAWLLASTLLAAPRLADAQAAAPSATPSQAQPDPLSPLDGLLGRWTFEDRSTAEAGFDYVERGTRVCERAIKDSYVVCRSVSEGPRPREYHFFFNYNDIDKRFEMIALFSNWGRKMRYDVRVFDGGRRLELVADAQVRPDRVDRSWATIRVESDSRIVWETRRNRSDRLPDDWPVITREVATRIR